MTPEMYMMLAICIGVYLLGLAGAGLKMYQLYKDGNKTDDELFIAIAVTVCWPIFLVAAIFSLWLDD